MIALLGAMRQEIAGLRKRMGLRRPAGGTSGSPIYRGRFQDKEVLLAQTGMGQYRAEQCARALLEQYPVSALVSLGFCGALASRLRVGDVVVGERLFDGDDETGVLVPDPHLFQSAIRALQSTGLRVSTGAGVTMPRLITQPAEKEALGHRFQAAVVDMESYGLARIAANQDTPFLMVRAVSDAQQDRLPPLDEMLAPSGMLRHIGEWPRMLGALPGLVRNTRLAARNLTAAAAAIVAGLEGESKAQTSRGTRYGEWADPAPDATWQVWYEDTFDRECPRQVDASGQGLAAGIAQLWTRHLRETVQASGQRGFSRFNLWWKEEGRSVEAVGSPAGMVHLREWILSEPTVARYDDPVPGLLSTLALVHSHLVLEGKTSESLVAAAAACSEREEFEDWLANKVQSIGRGASGRRTPGPESGP